MKHCCESFSIALENAEKRGVSMAVSEDSLGKPMFYLVFRMLDKANEAVTRLVMSDSDAIDRVIDFSYSEQLIIEYCPWCGVKLARRYKKTWVEMPKSIV